MDFNAYQTSGHIKYQRLAEAVANILAAALLQQPKLQIQHIQRRAKDPESLRKKLNAAGKLQTESIELAVKDLAGCRLLFYTNSDVSTFQSSDLITDNFDVDWTRTKIHHPRRDAETAIELFISNNYVVRLKDDRVALPEYAEFRDMWCEVQVQTTLNHAWSEMAHDTIYKRPSSEGFGTSQMKEIEKRMHRIMRDYLLPAGYEFQKVVADFERLSQGKELFDQGALQRLESCADNNGRYDLLRRFAEYLLPSYDDLKGVHAEIRAAVVRAVQQAYDTPLRPMETPFGDIPGHTVRQVVDAAADTIDYLRYQDVESTFEAICVLYEKAQSDEERKRWIESAERLAEPSLNVWRQAGPVIQHLLAERINRMRPNEVTKVRHVVIKVLEQLLETELTGISSTHDAVTLHRGAAPASDALAASRASAISVLERMLSSAGSDIERRSVLHALAKAMRTPGVGRTSESLYKLILTDTLRIVEFYISIAPTLSFELLQHLEESLLWEYQRKREAREDDTDPETATVRGLLVERILAFRDAINADQQFVIYKTLVGFESVFPPWWEGRGLGVVEENAYVERRAEELVSNVNFTNAEEWFSILRRCAETESDDLATFPRFGRFLENLGKTQPDIVLSYLRRLDGKLSRFIPSMVDGIVAAGRHDDVRKTLRDWVEKRRYLGQVIWHERFAAAVDTELLERAAEAAIEQGDRNAVLRALGTAAARHKDAEGGLIDQVALPAIRYLESVRETAWINALSPGTAGSDLLLKDLNEDQVDFLLTALVRHSRVGDRVEEVLQVISLAHPKKIVDFFGQRLGHQPELDDGERYEAIPFEFHHLPETLALNVEYIVDSVRGWFEQDESQFAYRGGRFLTNVFPSITREFERCLLGFSTTGARKDLEFLTQVLRSYRGQDFIHNLCKEVISALPQADGLLEHIAIAIDEMGVVTGQFGMVQAYEHKKSRLQEWLTDSREPVRAFATRHIHTLEQQIAAETRRSEEETERRKRDYEQLPDVALQKHEVAVPQTAVRPRLGILAFGSMIQDPGPEIQQNTTNTIPGVLTPFKVEFARASNTRGGAPTLVPVTDGGAQVEAVVFGLRSSVSEQQAMDMVWRRETRTQDLSKHYVPTTQPEDNTVIVEALSNFAGLDYAYVTKIAATCLSDSAEQLAKRAIASVLAERTAEDGISYLLAAKASGIQTPKMEAYERAILQQTQASNLTDAIAIVQRKGKLDN